MMMNQADTRVSNLAWGFDPGETTGWSLVQYSDGESIDEGDIKFSDMTTWLLSRSSMLLETRVIVIEDFSLFAGKATAQIGSKFETVQVIGMLKLWAASGNCTVVLQPPNIKSTAEKFTGRVPKGAHSKSHVVDAHNHVEYHLEGIGHYETVFQRELRNRATPKGR